jgi:YggT family protein
MSWIHPDPNNPIVSFIDSVTDPVLRPIRDFLPQNGMGIDFSPLIVFFGLGIIERILLGGSYGYYGF